MKNEIGGANTFIIDAIDCYMSILYTYFSSFCQLNQKNLTLIPLIPVLLKQFFFRVSFQVPFQIACLNRPIAAFLALVRLFPTMSYQMFP